MNRAILQQTLEFLEFCWRDVDMNDYAFERLESTIDAIRAELEKRLHMPTDGYVQPVPDKCDRIVWRNKYYHLPL